MRRKTQRAGNNTEREFKIYSISELKNILLRERARADRNDHEFSLIVFNISEKKRNKVFIADFFETLKYRLRSIDEVGWINEHQIGIVLPYTSAKNAMKVCEVLHDALKDDVIVQLDKIFTYPSLWPYKKDNGYQNNDVTDDKIHIMNS